MGRFRVGDAVIGNSKSGYAVTHKGWVGTVVEIPKEGQITARAVPGHAGGVFRDLREECFDMYYPAPGGYRRETEEEPVKPINKEQLDIWW